MKKTIKRLRLTRGASSQEQRAEYFGWGCHSRHGSIGSGWFVGKALGNDKIVKVGSEEDRSTEASQKLRVSQYR